MLGGTAAGYQRLPCLKLSAAVIVFIHACMWSEPAVWTLSRKDSNRLCHALNGNTSAFESQLRDILSQKGYPASVVNDRVKNAIKTLGAKTLQLEFDKKDSLQGLWNRLKAAATRHNFRWITRDELNSAKKNRGSSLNVRPQRRNPKILG